MIYFCIYFYLLFCAIWYDSYCKKKYYNFNYILIGVVLVLVSGLRYRLGQDTVAYMKSFDYEIVPIGDLQLDDILESRNQILWVLLNSFCKTFGSFALLQILISAFLHISIFYFVHRTCSKSFTVILIYYLYSYIYFSMEILRESLSISCFLFALLQLNRGSIVKYYVWSLFAFGFHFFACFLFLLPMFLTKRISLKWKLLLLSVIFVLAFMSRDQLILFFAGVTPESVGVKLLGYASNPDYFDGNMNAIGTIIKFLLPSSVIVFMLFYFRKRENTIFQIKNYIWQSCLVLYVFCLLATLYVPILERFSNYFYIIVCILFASCIYTPRLTIASNSLVLFFVSIIMLSYQLKVMLETDSNAKVPVYAKYYPYASIFNKEETHERALFNSYWSGY